MPLLKMIDDEIFEKELFKLKAETDHKHYHLVNRLSACGTLCAWGARLLFRFCGLQQQGECIHSERLVARAAPLQKRIVLRIVRIKKQKQNK